MEKALIIDACRTAVGTMGGALKSLPAVDMACAVLDGSLKRSQIDPELIDEVIMGQCRQSSDEPNLARIASLRVGITERASAHTVMRQCASGMTAVQNGVMQIACGVSDIVLAGGTESMSNGIFYLRGARYGLGTGTAQLLDSVTEGQFQSQPNEIYGSFNMGHTAENVARLMNISRQEQDAYALLSQQKAAAAIQAGRFKQEIIPLEVPSQKHQPPVLFDTDEAPRPGVTMEKLARLPAVFADDGLGTVTAGNSCGRNDGASAMLLMGERRAKELGLEPLGRVLGISSAGCDPRTMGLGPVYAVPSALKMAGLSIDDIGLIELNEAFAAQTIGCIRMLHWEDKLDILNVNGGAIALGHPVGSSGCRIMVTLLHEMRRRRVQYGLATLCIAGGMGQAVVLEALL